MSPGRVPSPSHHVPVQWLRPGRCTSLQFQRGSAQAKRLVPSQGCPGRSGGGRVQDPRRGKPGPSGPETVAAPPRLARVPGQRTPGSAAAASRGHRGRGPSVRPVPGARPRPPQLSPASAATAASRPLAAHLPGRRRRRRRRRRRCCSYHQISRDFAPPRAYPPPA